MKITKYFRVADHVFAVCAQVELLKLMRNYEPFICEPTDNLVFELTISSGEAPAYEEEIRQEDEGQIIICGHTPDKRPVFEFGLMGQTAGWVVCAADYSNAELITTGYDEKFAIDNALMVLYALATANQQTALFHAAVVSCQGKGFLFLGVSGTGKSTHARLWLQHIEGTELVNDDNPVVRISAEGEAIVYGSPWSGKTPCYRNVSMPVGGMVQLNQAPHNSIRRMSGIEAYASLILSISGKRWDKGIADGLHQTENWLAGHVPMWFLDCLPNEDAARLCRLTVT